MVAEAGEPPEEVTGADLTAWMAGRQWSTNTRKAHRSAVRLLFAGRAADRDPGSRLWASGVSIGLPSARFVSRPPRHSLVP
jgi:hypothetical protein